MKTNPNDLAYPAMDMNSYQGIDRLELRHNGMTKRELMAIEFTKTLLGLRHYDNQPIYTLSKRHYDPDSDPAYGGSSYRSQEHADEERLKEAELLTEKALFVADALINALNNEN